MLPLLYVPGISSRLLSDSLGVHIPERVSDEIAQPLTRDKLVSKYQMKRDTLFLSDIGKQMRLHISEQDTPDKIADASWSNVTNSRFNKHLQLYDKHISKAGELLEQMKEIAEAAQDASLDDLDRINLQIEMGQLQHELDTETDVMIGMVRHQFEPGTESYIRETHGKFQDSDAYDMLVRTRERIINGEEWDVAEICHVIYDTDEISKVGVEWEITDDETVPTIGDILKGRGRSVMDSESAIVSAAELEKNIADLAKQREKLVSTITKVGANPQSGGYDKRFFDMVRGLGEHLGSFLGSLSRDGTQITFGDSKDIYGNYTEGNGRDFGLEVIEVSEPNSAEFLDLEQKSVEDAVLWTTVADSQLRSRLSNGRGDNLEDRK